jgi:flagellar hook-length control protein FliK
MNSVAVNGVATNMSKSFGTKEKVSSNAFDTILGKTMDSQKNIQVKGDGNKTNQPDELMGEHKSIRIKSDATRVKDELYTGNQSDIKTEYDEMDVKDAVKDSLKEIAKTLGLSDEELSELMSLLNITFTDLYSKDGLGKLLSEVFGTNNEISLLTHSEAFEAFKDIKVILEDVLNQLNMDFETFKDAYESLKLSNQDIANLTDDVIPEASIHPVQSNKPHVEIEDTRTSQNNNIETAKDQSLLSTDDINESVSVEKNAEGNGNNTNQNSNDNSSFLNHFENVLSNTVSHKFEVVTANGVEETVYYETGAKEILSQITTQIKVSFTDDATTLFLQLQPENLGKVAFSVKSVNGMLTGNFVAENSTVKEAIEQNLATLKASLDQQGVKLDQVKVVVGNTNQFFHKDDQEKAYNQNAFKQKRKRHFSGKIEGIDTSIQPTTDVLRDIGLEEKSSVEYSA